MHNEFRTNTRKEMRREKVPSRRLESHREQRTAALHGECCSHIGHADIHEIDEKRYIGVERDSNPICLSFGSVDD